MSTRKTTIERACLRRDKAVLVLGRIALLVQLLPLARSVVQRALRRSLSWSMFASCRSKRCRWSVINRSSKRESERGWHGVQVERIAEARLLALLGGQCLDGLEIEVVVEVQVVEILAVNQQIQHVVALPAHLSRNKEQGTGDRK